MCAALLEGGEGIVDAELRTEWQPNDGMAILPAAAVRIRVSDNVVLDAVPMHSGCANIEAMQEADRGAT